MQLFACLYMCSVYVYVCTHLFEPVIHMYMFDAVMVHCWACKKHLRDDRNKTGRRINNNQQLNKYSKLIGWPSIPKDYQYTCNNCRLHGPSIQHRAPVWLCPECPTLYSYI